MKSKTFFFVFFFLFVSLIRSLERKFDVTVHILVTGLFYIRVVSEGEEKEQDRFQTGFMVAAWMLKKCAKCLESVFNVEKVWECANC